MPLGFRNIKKGDTFMESIVTALSTWGTTVTTDVTTMITTMLPIALGIVGLSLAVMLGIKFFKKVANKAG